MSGQINRGSPLGDAIYDLAKISEIQTIVEIGTWNGLGSTKCVLDALKYRLDLDDHDLCSFISLETSKYQYELALKNTPKLKNFRLIHGRILEISELVPVDHQYFREDLANYQSCSNVLDQLPDLIDLLILDGGDYTSELEFDKLADRSGIIVMDDSCVQKFKSRRDMIMRDQSQFEILLNVDEKQDTSRYGYMIIQNKRYPRKIAF